MDLDMESWNRGDACRHDMQWCADCKPRRRPAPRPAPPLRTPAAGDRRERSALRSERSSWTRAEADRTEDRPTLREERLPWTLPYDLRPWQVKALTAWEQASCRGVVEAATGTGKTAVALDAARRLHDRHGFSLYVVVVVPTQALANQWANAFRTELAVPERYVGELHSGGMKNAHGSGQCVLVTVINSARTRLPAMVTDWTRTGRKVLVVIDECHRAGAEANATVLDTPAQYTLGLSATPERSDNAHEERVYPGIGNPVYRYDLLKALDEDVLAPLRSINLYVDFTRPEKVQWDENTRRLSEALDRLERDYPGITSGPQMWARVSDLARREDPGAQAVAALAAARKEILSGSGERARCIASLEEWLVRRGDRSIVFHETIASAERIAGDFERLGAKVSLDHSQLRDIDRQRGLKRFRDGFTPILVAVRSLDEGIDVPDASVAVIASGSTSRRQRIQRLGRILRRSEGKTATAFTILVRGTPEEARVGGADDDLLGPGRVVHHRWPGRSIDDAFKDASTYTPKRGKTRLDWIVTQDRDDSAFNRQQPRSKTERSSRDGYTAVAAQFSPNAWHSVAEVRVQSGMPPEEFDRLWPPVRKAFRGSLGGRADDASAIHGQEIEAVRRRWEQQRRSGRRR